MFDAVETWRPSIVVSQVAERKLFYHGVDHQIDGFETIYHPNFRPAAGGRLLKAMLLRNQDPAAAKAAIVDHVGELAKDPVHAFSIALVMESAGDIDAAQRLIDDALEQRPDQPSFNALAARIALAKGQLATAVSFAAAAARLAPSNGYFHELHTYCVVQADGAAAAVKLVEAALRHVTDHPNLWYWASVCHAAVHQMAPAKAAIDCALALAPDDAAYLAHDEHVRSFAR
jgi:predicted Zn-dependent protease